MFLSSMFQKFIFACTCTDPNEPCNKDDDCLINCWPMWITWINNVCKCKFNLKVIWWHLSWHFLSSESFINSPKTQQFFYRRHIKSSFKMRFSIFLTLCFCYLVQNFEGAVAQATCHQCYGDNGLCNNANDQGHFTECSYVGDGVTCASVTQIGNGGANSYYRGCAEDYIDENIVSRCCLDISQFSWAINTFSGQCMLLLLWRRLLQCWPVWL